MHDPTPHGKFNRSKGIVLTLLGYCKDSGYVTKGLSLAAIGNFAGVHGMTYSSIRATVSRIHRYDLLKRKPIDVEGKRAILIYAISASGAKWLDNYVDSSMRETFMLPMLPKLHDSENDIRRIYGGWL